jgi:hypothetical protein
MNPVLLRVVCASEAVGGLVVLAYPALVARLLLGSEIVGAGIFMSRIAGIALIALGIACWPGGAARGLLGMTVYSAVTTVYMAGVGVMGGQTGALFWPAVAAHGVLSILLARLLFKRGQS